MKKGLVVVMMLVAVGVFAEGDMEVDSSTARLVDEVTQTIQEGKGLVSKYAEPTVEGLILQKKAYFGVVFPLVPILTLVSLVLIIIGAILWVAIVTDDWGIYVGGAFVWVFGLTFLICGIWSLVDVFEVRMFEAAPEIYVLKGLIGK